ncbi:hypothetical protein CCUS01_06292 [Colletotrichum cuscutae]|uniref:Uncharacterized protein n=1 Tax=Colletotrichum cuscutae TaxID=1209917 RepID=A0AAI9Y3S7_9PEZI|nr:hypothetical protein CCUS01_06292 [Colletotrichum cuscutae]
MEFKDIEITALSTEYAYSTMIQHTWGTAGGVPFDTAFRRMGIAGKNTEGQWKWIHEHLSFPTDMATKAADFTSSLDPLKATKMKYSDVEVFNDLLKHCEVHMYSYNASDISYFEQATTGIREAEIIKTQHRASLTRLEATYEVLTVG